MLKWAQSLFLCRHRYRCLPYQEPPLHQGPVGHSGEAGSPHAFASHQGALPPPLTSLQFCLHCLIAAAAHGCISCQSASAALSHHDGSSVRSEAAPHCSMTVRRSFPHCRAGIHCDVEGVQQGLKWWNLLQEESYRPDPLAQAIATLIKSDPEQYIDKFNFRSEICISCDWRRMELTPKVVHPPWHCLHKL